MCLFLSTAPNVCQSSGLFSDPTSRHWPVGFSADVHQFDWRGQCPGTGSHWTTLWCLLYQQKVEKRRRGGGGGGGLPCALPEIKHISVMQASRSIKIAILTTIAVTTIILKRAWPITFQKWSIVFWLIGPITYAAKCPEQTLYSR